MPIDFPTRKLADRATTTPTAPAADDTLQGQTVGGTDRVFLLGNLAGLTNLTIANDQAPYFAAGAWGAYNLTAAGRALSAVAGTANTFPYFSAANVVTLGVVGATGLASLAAANATAGRTAIGGADDTAVVHLTGTETVSGAKTFTGLIVATDSITVDRTGIGSIQLTAPSGIAPGFILRRTQSGSLYRSEIRANDARIQIGANPTAGSDVAPSRFFEVGNDYIRPSVTNVMSCGIAGNVWTQVFATNTTISTSDGRLKTEPRQLRDAEFKAASAIARLPAVWRWLSRVHGDENCEPEGREARKHFGPTVQAAIAVMEAHGLDPFAYSFICYDQWEDQEEQWHEWDAEVDPETGEVTREAGRELVQEAREAGDRYSFRKEELLCFLIAAMARQHDELEERVAALEAKLAA